MRRPARRAGWLLATWLLVTLLAALPGRALAAAPETTQAARRIVSLNLCTDELLVHLVPGRIAGLSELARDPSLSTMAKAARRWPAVRADAESVLARHPDLVLGGRFGAQATLTLLRAAGVPVLLVDMPQDFAAIARQVRQVSQALGVPGRGEAWLARMRRDLPPAPRPGAAAPSPRGTALLWLARGWSAGPGSLGDAILRAAGWRNVGTGGRMGLEALLAAPPDLLVVPSAPRFPSLATDLLTNPALRGIKRRAIDPAWLICATPTSARAVRALAR